MTVTHRFVKKTAGPERLEIRRYEDADEGIYLNRVQEHWAGRTDQVIMRRSGVRREGLLVPTFADDESGSSATKPNLQARFGDDRRVIPFFDVWLPKRWAFTPRGNCLVPYSLFGNGNVPTKEEVEDEVYLSSDGKESGH